MASPRNFVVCLKSIDRALGASNSYILSLPPLPQGSYKATFTIDTLQTTSTELCVRWPATDNYYESKDNDPFKTVCSFDSHPASGLLYIQNPASEVQVQFREAGSSSKALATIVETVIPVHFELIP